MTSRDFCYWLQGYFEVSNTKEIGPKETELIKAHLNMVFKHEIDPSMGNQEHQDALSHLHNPNNYGDNFYCSLLIFLTHRNL